MVTPDHLPVRPGWDCGACTQPWPCDQAREILGAAYRGFPSRLDEYMKSMRSMAADDYAARGQPVPADLNERFLDWTWPATRPARRTETTPESEARACHAA